jgi:hypothetical protein
MSAVAWPDTWEVGCRRPGVWLVEGYEVVRVRQQWFITVGAAYDRRHVGIVRRLRDAVEVIERDIHDGTI